MKHLLDAHNMKIKPKDNLKAVEILYQVRNRQELIMEALFIAERKPLLNNQEEGSDRIFKIF